MALTSERKASILIHMRLTTDLRPLHTWMMKRKMMVKALLKAVLWVTLDHLVRDMMMTRDKATEAPEVEVAREALAVEVKAVVNLVEVVRAEVVQAVVVITTSEMSVAARVDLAFSKRTR